MICPICKETLIPAEANFLECPTKINNYYYDGLSAPQISHYRRDVDWNLAWIKLYPYKIVQDYEYKETIFQILSKNGCVVHSSDLFVKHIMSDEDAIILLNRIKNLKAFL